MEQLKSRTLFISFFILCLCFGTLFLIGSYVVQGSFWAAHRSAGSVNKGTITDREGRLLYDFSNGSYSDDYEYRVSTVHAVGDKVGSIAHSAKSELVGSTSSFNLITGISGKDIDLQLTLDADLNARAYELLDGRKGVISLYNYKTGDILCMLSAPCFDPTDSEVIKAINDGDEKYQGAYVNRFLSSTYTPGSTFKVVTTAAALETMKNVDDFSFSCDSDLSYGDDSVTCPSSHGTVGLKSALAKSCNGAFATLANDIGGETLKEYAEKAGLLTQREVSGIKTAAGSFTVSKSAIEEGWSGVGQYKNLVNPCSEMTLMGCIAMDGTAAAPSLLPTTKKTMEKASIGWKASTCQTIREMMRNNVVNHYGQSQFGELPVCAKSGTAEVGSKDPHAWFVGFVDSKEYPYAFVVMVEHGGWGSSTAGGIAAKLLDYACN